MKNYLDLSFRVDGNNEAVAPGTFTSGDTSLLNRHNTVTFLVHGYNVKLKDSTVRLRELAKHFQAMASPVVGVHWPGNNWLKSLAYTGKGRVADDVGYFFARFIQDWELQHHVINFVSHSLGGRVVMETIKHLPSNIRINQVCVLAAALDDFCLDAPKQYKRELQRINRVCVLASKWDKTLMAAYPLGDLTHFFLKFQNRPGLAMGWHGPRPEHLERVLHVQIDNHEPDARADHGHYIPNPDEDKDKVRMKQRAAAAFTSDALSGMPAPAYRLRP